MPLREKLNDLRKVLTVEPIVLIFTMVYYNRVLVEHHLYLYFDFEQKLWIEDPIIYIILFHFLLPGIILLFVGSYSDQYAIKKPLLLLPLFGELFSYLGFFLCSENSKQCTLHVFYLLKIVPMCFGGIFLVLAMSFAYIAEITDHENRTFRIGILQLIILVDFKVIRYFDIFWSFDELNCGLWASVNGSLLLGIILYGIFWLPGPKWLKMRSFENILNPRHVYKTFNVLLVKRPCEGRRVIFILLGASVVQMALSVNNNYFLQDLETFKEGVWRYSSFMVAVLNTACVIIFTRCLRFRDVLILIGSLVYLSGSNMVFGLAQTVTGVTIAQAIYAPSTLLTTTVCVSMLTKTVSKEDYAKILFLYFLCNIFITTLMAILHFYFINIIKYQQNIIFFSAAALYSLLIPAVVWIYIQDKKHKRHEIQTMIVGDEDSSREIPL